MSSKEYTIDWERCVYVNGRIGDDIIETLTPQILKLRQAGNDPITLAINSFGGAIGTIEPLLALVNGPDQNGVRCTAITVVTHEAFSAAAVMLAFGDYAVALPHTSILLHDVRYNGMEDVTPDKAKSAARQLETVNETFALKLASSIFRRLVWQYIDVRDKFGSVVGDDAYARYSAIATTCNVVPTATVKVDVAGFAAWIHKHLSPPNQELVDRAFFQLQSWGATMNAAKFVPLYQNATQKGLLDGALDLFNAIKNSPQGSTPFGAKGLDEDLAIFLVRVVAQLAQGSRTAEGHLEAAFADFLLLKSINDPSHMDMVSKLMLRHKSAFFTHEKSLIATITTQKLRYWQKFDPM
jgi:ATP-dependent protease ClpP protease subunit